MEEALNKKVSRRALQKGLTQATSLLKMREVQVRYLLEELHKVNPDHNLFKKAKEVQDGRQSDISMRLGRTGIMPESIRSGEQPVADMSNAERKVVRISDNGGNQSAGKI